MESNWIYDGSRPFQSMVAESKRREEATMGESILWDGTPMTDETPIDMLELTVRSANALKGAEIMTVGEIRKRTDKELLREPNLGKISLREIRSITGPHTHQEKRNAPYYADQILSERVTAVETTLASIARLLEKYTKSAP